MAFTAGNTLSTGHVVTATDWNNYLGSTGSVDYLKTETDKLDDVSHSEPGNSLDTTYQNTTGKIVFVTICITYNTTNDIVHIQHGTTSPPATEILRMSVRGTDKLYDNCAFMVVPNYYYTASSQAGNCTLVDWHEWDLH